jgi:hypothetical protein
MRRDLGVLYRVHMHSLFLLVLFCLRFPFLLSSVFVWPVTDGRLMISLVFCGNTIITYRTALLEKNTECVELFRVRVLLCFSWVLSSPVFV